MPRYFFQVSNGESAFKTKWASKPENYRGYNVIVTDEDESKRARRCAL
jgi:hypothetical protein